MGCVVLANLALAEAEGGEERKKKKKKKRSWYGV